MFSKIFNVSEFKIYEIAQKQRLTDVSVERQVDFYEYHFDFLLTRSRDDFNHIPRKFLATITKFDAKIVLLHSKYPHPPDINTSDGEKTLMRDLNVLIFSLIEAEFYDKAEKNGSCVKIDGKHSRIGQKMVTLLYHLLIHRSMIVDHGSSISYQTLVFIHDCNKLKCHHVSFCNDLWTMECGI